MAMFASASTVGAIAFFNVGNSKGVCSQSKEKSCTAVCACRRRLAARVSESITETCSEA